MVQFRFFWHRCPKLVFQENQLREVIFMSKSCNFLYFPKIQLLSVFPRKNGYFSYFFVFFLKKKIWSWSEQTFWKTFIIPNCTSVEIEEIFDILCFLYLFSATKSEQNNYLLVFNFLVLLFIDVLLAIFWASRSKKSVITPSMVRGV